MKPIIITGITGSGKSALAVNIAKSFNGKACVVNADASQLYSELKILTAYPTQQDVDAVSHKLFGILSPNEKISVSDWKILAEKTIAETPVDYQTIICGGTGFYIDALIHGIADIPSVPQEFRKQEQQRFDTIGREKFFNELLAIDPQTKLHPNDTQRILRAYEVALYTGKPLSQWWTNKQDNENQYNMTIIIPDRSTVAERCHVRLQKMIDNGLKEELIDFTKKYPNYTGSLCSAVGYKEGIDWINGEISQDEFLRLTHIRTMQYAKRQSTWFRNKFTHANFIKEAKL